MILGRARVLTRAALGAAFLLGAVGLLHTRAGRPLLAMLGGGGAGGCPVSLAGATPEKLEASRVDAVKTLRGEGKAAARPALTFTFDRTTRGEVTAWAKERGVSCKDELAGTALRCRDVDPRAVDDGAVPIADLFFRFDPAGKLVALDAMHADTGAADAERLLGDIEVRLAKSLDAPSSKRGEATAAYLGATPYGQASFEYRFHDYAADVSATNFPGRGVVVREQYRALD